MNISPELHDFPAISKCHPGIEFHLARSDLFLPFALLCWWDIRKIDVGATVSDRIGERIR
jgi:hypothetical protein